jgi:hypothetical protein
MQQLSEEFESRGAFKTDLIQKLQSIYHKAICSVNKSHQAQAKYYNEHHVHVSFQVNDLVMVRSHYLSDKSKKFTKKFADKWDGPYKVVKIMSPVTYELDIPTSAFKVHNIKNLKSYFDRPAITDSFICDADSKVV